MLYPEVKGEGASFKDVTESILKSFIIFASCILCTVSFCKLIWYLFMVYSTLFLERIKSFIMSWSSLVLKPGFKVPSTATKKWKFRYKNVLYLLEQMILLHVFSLLEVENTFYIFSIYPNPASIIVLWDDIVIFEFVITIYIAFFENTTANRKQ